MSTLDFLSITKDKYTELQEHTQREINQLQTTILNGWPNVQQEVPASLCPYWDSRSELAVCDGIIYKGMGIVVPPSLGQQMLNLVHESHLGIIKCKQRAREVLHWPAMNSDIEETVENCTKCADFQRKLPSEPLIPTETPGLFFMMVMTDLFDFESNTYLLTVDYYSKFIEVERLQDLGSKATIEVLKVQFCRHGIPEVIRRDVGPQFASKDFARFCKILQDFAKNMALPTKL